MDSQYKAANVFSDVKVESFPRHVFDLSYTNSFTCNHGLAIPALVIDVKPGDKIDINSFGRVQLQPLATATMQNINCYMRYFYVPYRILWNDWDKFISQDGFVESPLIAPYYQINSVNLNAMLSSGPGGLMDMLGYQFYNFDRANKSIPFNVNAKLQFTSFRHLAYWKIWDRYFRDENLVNTVCPESDQITSGYLHLSPMINSLLPVAWEKDYFTTALPWTQKGQPVMMSSLFNNSIAPVSSHLVGDDGTRVIGDLFGKEVTTAGTPEGTYDILFRNISNVSQGSTGSLLLTSNLQDIYASFDINELRYANALQRYLERLALGGNRPAEFYLSMYGVKIDDLRIGDPLYLGGGKNYVNVTPVTQQSETTSSSPQGTLAGNGTSNPQMSINEPYYCQEFGIIMGIFYIRPELNYSQGIPRQTQLYSHLDYYNPIFAHLGEEPVYKSELVFGASSDNSFDHHNTNNDEIFGYQSRYAYLKHRRNEVHGDLVSTLNSWLLSYHWDVTNGLPELNEQFITVQQNYDIFAVTDARTHHYICEIHHSIECESSMPDFSIPSL